MVSALEGSWFGILPQLVINDNYAALLGHYGLRSIRINRVQSHENCVSEHGHHRLKDDIDQALILRGSRDFDTTDDCADFVGEMVKRRNRLVQGKLEQERDHLRPLPPAPMPEYVNYRARVRNAKSLKSFVLRAPNSRPREDR